MYPADPDQAAMIRAVRDRYWPPFDLLFPHNEDVANRDLTALLLSVPTIDLYQPTDLCCPLNVLFLESGQQIRTYVLGLPQFLERLKSDPSALRAFLQSQYPKRRRQIVRLLLESSDCSDFINLVTQSGHARFSDASRKPSLRNPLLHFCHIVNQCHIHYTQT